MKIVIRPVSDHDWDPVTSIFNHFVVSSFAAYPDQTVDQSAFRRRHKANPDYPFLVADISGVVVGFAFLSPFHPATTMRHTAAVTYFLHPDHTGKGLGSALLESLVDACAELGITNLLAHVSSMNSGSVRFHLTHGFTECGRFLEVGVKHGRPFDMIWLQKLLD